MKNRTPKEKALTLVQKYAWLGTKCKQTAFYTLELENAKQCALIDVQNTIDALEIARGHTSGHQNNSEILDDISHFEKIKLEIEKLEL